MSETGAAEGHSPLFLKPPSFRNALVQSIAGGNTMQLRPGETVENRLVRFRTLGCYPLTGAVESRADTLPAIIQEMLLTTSSERQGRVIDHDSAASMEKKKQEGYF